MDGRFEAASKVEEEDAAPWTSRHAQASTFAKEQRSPTVQLVYINAFTPGMHHRRIGNRCSLFHHALSLFSLYHFLSVASLSLHFYFPFFLLFIHLLILNLGNGPYDAQFLVMLCISNAIDYTLRFSNHSDWHLQFVMRCPVHTQRLSNAHMQLTHAQHVLRTYRMKTHRAYKYTVVYLRIRTGDRARPCLYELSVRFSLVRY